MDYQVNPYPSGQKDNPQKTNYPMYSTIPKEILNFRNPIIESVNWNSPEFHLEPTGTNTIKIKGVAIPRNAISRNKRQYLDEELKTGARTFWDTPITVNHLNWQEKKNQKGKVNFMEYDNTDGSMEYIAEVWDKDLVNELRLYKANPSASKIAGVSIEADYLSLLCPQGCKEHFTSQEAWAEHMSREHFVKDGLGVPHGLRGRALSIVIKPESCGVPGNTLEVMESANTLKGLDTLCEAMLKDKGVTEDFAVTSSGLLIGPKPKTVDIVKEYQSFLENHSDPKVKEAFNYLLTIMDKRVNEAESRELPTKLKVSTVERDALKETVKTQTDSLTELNAKLSTLTAEKTNLQREVTRREALVEANRKLQAANDNLTDKLLLATKGKAQTPFKKPNVIPNYNYTPNGA